MMGYQSDPGLIPRFCEDLFKFMVDEKVAPIEPHLISQTKFKTEVSYFEIYSENIYDLLSQKSAGPKRKVRLLM